MLLSSSSTFSVIDAPVVQASIEFPVLPLVSSTSGNGRLVHPILGAFSYDVKPDEWVNIDGDVFILPIWSSTKTLGGAANVLWSGNIRDVVVEERWKQSLAMTVAQLRLMLAVFTNPVDPATGYVQWWPNYTTDIGYNVLPIGFSVGGQGITLTDLINAKTVEGNPDGWVEYPVVFTLKIVSKVA